jgi:hypothetical protein
MFLIGLLSLGVAALFLMASKVIVKDTQRRQCPKKKEPKPCRRPAKKADRRSCIRKAVGMSASTDESEEDDSEEEESDEE